MKLHRFLSVLMAPLAASLAIAAAPAPASASTVASCTDISRFDISAGSIFVPTVGSQTHQDNCLLGVGNQSVAVQLLQWDINTCYGLNIAEDGIFGPQTEGAVQYVQALGGVTQDGIYGPVTRSIMRWYVFGPGACRLGF